MSFKYPIAVSEALISEDKVHRYSLTRKWNKQLWTDHCGLILFIGLNPSRADAVYNDATINRCIRFAQDWGYRGMFFANLYSFRTPYVHGPIPAHLNKKGWVPLLDKLDVACNDLTDVYLRELIKASDTVVCAWGSWKFTKEREKQVLAMIDQPMCFGRNKDGAPKHPLYLAKTSQLESYGH